MQILREPLLHFLVLGTLVYAGAVHFGDDSARYRIDAGPARRARLEAAYREQYGSSPTPGQVQELLNEYVRSEILYREGLAMGLERDDEIVRRRVVQKIEFVNEDLETQAEPSEAQLKRFYEQNRDRYTTAATVSFRHLFFSADRGGPAAAKARAQAVLQLLGRGVRHVIPESSDPFAEGAEFAGLSQIGADAAFGDSGLSEALFSEPLETWAGPFRSAYGWHLLYITERQVAKPAPLTEVKSRVRADYLADLRDKRNGLAFSKIASKYRVISGGPNA
jgi:peptidyl-prolyl cis-trans isomerase C